MSCLELMFSFVIQIQINHKDAVSFADFPLSKKTLKGKFTGGKITSAVLCGSNYILLRCNKVPLDGNNLSVQLNVRLSHYIFVVSIQVFMLHK